MCMTIDEGRAMIAPAEAQAVTLMVGYTKRYDPGYEYAQRIFESMEAVRLIRVHDLTGRGPLAPQEILRAVVRYAADGAPVRLEGSPNLLFVVAFSRCVRRSNNRYNGKVPSRHLRREKRRTPLCDRSKSVWLAVA